MCCLAHRSAAASPALRVEGGTAAADNAPEHVVKYRQNLMTRVGARFANVAALCTTLTVSCVCWLISLAERGKRREDQRGEEEKETSSS